MALQKAGYNNDVSTPNDEQLPIAEDELKIELLSTDAIPPTRATPQSAGLDLYSTIDGIVKQNEHLIVPIDIAFEPKSGTYGQVLARSSFAAKGITVLGGVIDADYRGNIKVILQNNSKNEFQVKKGQRVAQLVIKKISLPTVKVVDKLNSTERGAQGFGSTEKLHKHMPRPLMPVNTPISIDSTTAAAAAGQ